MCEVLSPALALRLCWRDGSASLSPEKRLRWTGARGAEGRGCGSGADASLPQRPARQPECPERPPQRWLRLLLAQERHWAELAWSLLSSRSIAGLVPATGHFALPRTFSLQGGRMNERGWMTQGRLTRLVGYTAGPSAGQPEGLRIHAHAWRGG